MSRSIVRRFSSGDEDRRSGGGIESRSAADGDESGHRGGGDRNRPSGEGDDGLPEDLVFRILSNRRRREVLRCLRDREDSAEIGELARQIAARENDVAIEAVTHEQRKSVYTSLHQNHLPRLDDAGVIEADRRWQGIEPTERAGDFDPYLSEESPPISPGSAVFFSLSLLELLILGEVWLDLSPWSLTPGLGPVVLLASVLFLSTTAASVLGRPELFDTAR